MHHPGESSIYESMTVLFLIGSLIGLLVLQQCLFLRHTLVLVRTVCQGTRFCTKQHTLVYSSQAQLHCQGRLDASGGLSMIYQLSSHVTSIM